MCLVQDRQKLILLLQKAYFGQLSEEEAGLLAEWRSRSSEHEALYRRIMSGESLAELLEWQNHFDPEQANRSILHRVEKRRSIRMRKIGLRVAAIVLLLLGIGTIWIINRQGDYRRQQELAFTLIHPGTPQAILTLADGRQVVLDKKPVTLKLNEKQFLTGDSAILNYAVNLPNGLENNEQQTLMHKVEVPVGGEYRLVLADGTKVWINAESSLQYPVEFTAEQRTVILQGEAYFEVTKNRHKPFTVESDAMRVRVLGTTFNFKCDKRCRIAEATLIEGEIEVKGNKDEGQIVLAPGQRAELNRNSGRLTVKQVDAKLDAVWRDNLIPFNKANIFTITKALERFYDVKIILSPDIRSDKTYSGVLKKKSTIESVLKSLQNSIPIEYKIVGNNIFISSDKK